jgi:hypothetical protein
MASETKLELCAYCGLEPGTTVDHIPPKLFFAPPYPSNLLTVPACTACNKSFQADDEYCQREVSLSRSHQNSMKMKTKSNSGMHSATRTNRTFSKRSSGTLSLALRRSSSLSSSRWNRREPWTARGRPPTRGTHLHAHSLVAAFECRSISDLRLSGRPLRGPESDGCVLAQLESLA